MKPSLYLIALFGACLVTLGASLPATAVVSPPAANSVWHYNLINGSELTDDCAICGRPSIVAPMRGSFRLRLTSQNPLFSNYALDDISFIAGRAPGRQYTVRGRGTYQIGGAVAVVQEMFLAVEIDDGFTTNLCYFTNRTATLDRPFPILQVKLEQTNSTLLQEFRLMLVAAPFREIWFSSVTGFTSGTLQSPMNRVSGGDFVSSVGRVVKRNRELIRQLGLPAAPPDLGLDAVDILPGGELAFSLEDDAMSTTLGPLQHGDLISENGRIIKRNHDLLAAFVVMPPVTDVGLDAVHVLDSGEAYFSIETNVFSQRLGVTLQRGDVLSSSGAILKSNRQLLAAFHPSAGGRDYGVDALYVWPGGEIWFSVEEGFLDQQLGTILPGDLLSDQGSIVAGNLELLSAFAPRENLVDFGLDALFIVSDATPPAQPPHFLETQLVPPGGPVGLSWEGKGRVWQLLRALDVTGPYLPYGPITPDNNFYESLTPPAPHKAFYHLQQW